jgi:DeoR/GlpR family transcriptional regulator of sugar metabolism
MCFDGCSGITPDFGFSMRDRPEAAVARAFHAVSERTVVLADHRKVGRSTLARFAPLSNDLSLVTDDGLDPEWQRTLRLRGLEVVLASGMQASPDPGGPS